MKLMTTLTLAMVMLIFLLTWQLSLRSDVYFDKRCFANITYVGDSDSSFLFKGNVTVEFNKDKTGAFNISGNVDYQGRQYQLSRFITFSYHNVSGNQYRMNTTTKDIMAHDNIPKNITPLTIKIFGMEGEYATFLEKRENNYITIANTLSPLMNCVIQ
ncbi:hypothetical protein CWR52_10060 [Enterobacter sp. SGAir0187]|uniref:hypothetical protein n=1 Tax=Enterobacter sp. SGAir0187 TaxID=2836161 RepID=UPI000CEB43D9|nr:hypothetical protein [Enterobacter sp. SGAir0187]AVH17525.1 hypothetical protein CWR52_10060 [Enterobacter sp. SGAir0187]